MTAVHAMASRSASDCGANSPAAPGSPPSHESAPNVFPLLPLRGLVAFPHASYPIFVGRPMSINAVSHAKERNIPILLTAQRDPRVADVTSSEMYEVGTIAAIVETIRLPDGTLKTVIEGKTRAHLSHFSFDQEFSKAAAEEIEEPAIPDSRLEILISAVLAAFVREQVRTVSAWVSNLDATGVSAAARILREGWNAKQVGSASVLADRIASALRMELALKQALLELLNPVERLEKLLAYLNALS